MYIYINICIDMYIYIYVCVFVSIGLTSAQGNAAEGQDLPAANASETRYVSYVYTYEKKCIYLYLGVMIDI